MLGALQDLASLREPPIRMQEIGVVAERGGARWLDLQRLLVELLGLGEVALPDMQHVGVVAQAAGVLGVHRQGFPETTLRSIIVARLPTPIAGLGFRVQVSGCRG